MELPRDKAANADLVLPARTIPSPRGASEQARAYLSTPVQTPPRPALAYDDVEGWRAAVAELDAASVPVVQNWIDQAQADVEKTSIADVTVYRAEPHSRAPWTEGKAHLHIHGGGWAFYGGAACGGFAAREASALGCTTFSVDYRRPPDHRFPAALDDCVAVYRRLLDTYAAQDIVISGLSAGANLAATTTLRIRDEGLPLPAAVGLLTPLTDAAMLGDSLFAYDQLDHVLTRAVAEECLAVYAAGHTPTDPYLSPLYGDFTKGFPPTFIQSGTRDLLLSDSARLHRALRRAGIEAELHIWEAMPHGGFGGAPEDDEIHAELRAFFRKAWSRGGA